MGWVDRCEHRAQWWRYPCSGALWYITRLCRPWREGGRALYQSIFSDYCGTMEQWERGGGKFTCSSSSSITHNNIFCNRVIVSEHSELSMRLTNKSRFTTIRITAASIIKWLSCLIEHWYISIRHYFTLKLQIITTVYKYKCACSYYCILYVNDIFHYVTISFIILQLNFNAIFFQCLKLIKKLN